MPDVVAKAMAVITGFLLVGVVAILVVTSRPPSNTRQVVAQFRDAFPTLEGFQVRTDGAPAGSVGKITVNKQGLAEVTLLVDKDVPAPRADATATIRQFDSTGDSYVAYDPGTASGPLPERDGKPTISCDAPAPTAPCTNTLAAPRLDDLVNAFGPSEQAGIKLILQNLSDALDQRGADVNKAALRLVPALDAANEALAEVNGQNAALKRLIDNMESVARQGASRRTELGQLIGELENTLSATASKTAALDAGLQVLPQTQVKLRRTLAGLERTATETRPLAVTLADAAPQLSTLLTRTPGFLRDVRTAIRLGGPTLELTRQLLVAGGPTIEADPQRVVTGSFDLAPALSNLLTGILGSDDTIKAFFGDEKYGKAEDRKAYGYGLGAVSSEPGDQSGFPADWAPRNWVRTIGIVNCETFGAAVKPGCLANLLAARERQGKTSTTTKPSVSPLKLPLLRPRPAPTTPSSGTAAPTPKLPVTVPDGPVKDATEAADSLLEFLFGGGHG